MCLLRSVALLITLTKANALKLPRSHYSDDDTRPRMLAMDDCSGSTFVMHTAAELLRRHGHEIYWTDYEALKPNKNWAYQKNPSAGMAAAVDTICRTAKEKKSTWVFDAEAHRMSEAPEVAPVLTAHGTFVTHVYRSNLLDQAVCVVRDCFDGVIGKPVSADGEDSDLCFDRRFTSADVKARLDPAKVLVWINERRDRARAYQQNLQQWGFQPSKVLTYEELAAFQYDTLVEGPFPYSCDFDCSLRAWCKFMLSWGISPHVDVVKDYLLELKHSDGAHGRPTAHANVIFNIDQVREAFRSAGTLYEQFIRE